MLDCALGHVEEQLCPEDGGWSQWSAWGECEGECGGVGRQLRTRNCSNPQPQRNGADCDGADCDGGQLEVKPCSVPGCSYEQYENLLAQDAIRLQELANLKKYSGSKSAILAKCLSSHCDFSDVSQAIPSVQTKFWNSLICVKKNTGCPAAGGWGDWSPWTRCNARCGSGQKMRCRACCDPPPSSANMTCRGPPCEFQPCTGTDCGRPLSKSGEWSQWSGWSACSSRCNFGYMRRRRVCQNQSQMSSNKKHPALRESDYDDDDGDGIVIPEEDSNYRDDGDDVDNDDDGDEGDGERTVDNFEDYRYEFDDTHASYKRFKRRTKCDKVEYYNNDEGEDLLSTTLKFKRTATKTERKTSEQMEITGEIAAISVTHCFKQSKIQTSSTTTVENLSDLITQNEKSDEPTIQILVKKNTRKPISEAVEFLTTAGLSSSIRNERDTCVTSETALSTKQCPKPLPKPKKHGIRVTNPILPDYQDQQCNDLYENASTGLLCNSKQVKHVSVTDSSVNQDKTKRLPSAVPYSAQVQRSVESDAVRLNISSSIVLSSTRSWGSKNSVNTERTGNLATTSCKTKSSPSGTGSVKIANTSPVSTGTQRLLTISPGSPSTGNFTLPLARTTPTGNLSGISYMEATTIKTTSSHSETAEVVEELLASSQHPSSCDLSKKLNLPSFKDSFPAEECSGPFEELKPCNTQPCNEDGGWSAWSSWSPCLPDCGLGWQDSVRSCTNPEPSRNKTGQCPGEASRRQSCYLQPCPVTLKTSKAMFTTGDSVVQYEALQQHSSILLVYVRLRHFSPTGSVVTRRPRGCSHNNKCDHVALSLYRGHVLVSVLQQKCYAHFLSSQRFSVGDWHEVLLTVVGSVVTLRLDDSVLVQKFNLSCHPTSPNYDTDMVVGGTRFVGEVDRLIVNFKNYVFQKKRDKRDLSTLNNNTITPSNSTQVQYEMNSRDIPSVSLSDFLLAPCFTNKSSWNIDLAIKPKFSDGLVLFVKGYDSRDFLFVSLEQTRIRLRIRVAVQSGECEYPEPVAPLTWIHIGLSRTAESGGVGLSVNGGPHCIVRLDPFSAEEPFVYCTGGILLGEMPLRVKTVLASEAGHAEPLHSPFGLLGHLAVDNHTLDLSRLPRKIAPDLTTQHPDHQYRLSSHTAATTVYYEEMLVLQGEQLSMPCIYDLSPENVSNASSIQELDNNWYKLDTPVITYFSNESGVHFETPTTGKAVSLNITKYPFPETVEGFYSCWLHYPLPLQSGLNIVTYGVVIVSTTQDKRTWLFWLMIAHLCLVVILLVLLILFFVYEAYQDYKRGSGFYRCKKLKGNKAYKAVQLFILSDKVVNRLGGPEAAERALARYTESMEQEAQVEALREDVTDTDVTTENEAYQPNRDDQTKKRKSTDREIYHSLSNDDIYIPKNLGQKVTVGVAEVEFKSPFVSENSYSLLRSESRVTIEELLLSDTEDREETEAADVNDNLIDVSDEWTQKEVTGLTSREVDGTGIGQIQNTSAYRSIENGLKFKPEKFKNLGKYVYSKRNISDV